MALAFLAGMVLGALVIVIVPIGSQVLGYKILKYSARHVDQTMDREVLEGHTFSPAGRIARTLVREANKLLWVFDFDSPYVGTEWDEISLRDALNNVRSVIMRADMKREVNE